MLKKNRALMQYNKTESNIYRGPEKTAPGKLGTKGDRWGPTVQINFLLIKKELCFLIISSVY